MQEEFIVTAASVIGKTRSREQGAQSFFRKGLGSDISRRTTMLPGDIVRGGMTKN